MTREQAELVAIAAMPGWKIAPDPHDTGRVKPLTFGPPCRDLEEMKAKYFSEKPASPPKRNDEEKDTHFIPMTPKSYSGPNLIKMVLVSNGKVIGVQG